MKKDDLNISCPFLFFDVQYYEIFNELDISIFDKFLRLRVITYKKTQKLMSNMSNKIELDIKLDIGFK